MAEKLQDAVPSPPPLQEARKQAPAVAKTVAQAAPSVAQKAQEVTTRSSCPQGLLQAIVMKRSSYLTTKFQHLLQITQKFADAHLVGP